MAPPQVNLNEKKHTEGWVDPIVVHSPVPSAPPIKTADINVDCGVPIRRKRFCGNKRCKIIIAGAVVLVVLVIAAAVAVPLLHRRFAHGDRDHWNNNVEHDGFEAMEDVRTDGLNQRIIVDRDGNGRMFPMHAILDYSRKAAGYKDMDQQVCYLESPLQETYQQGCHRWRGDRDHHRRPAERPLRAVLGGQVDTTTLRAEAGDAIADMCQGLTTLRVEAVFLPPMGPPHPEGDDSHEEPPPTPLPAGDYLFV